MFGFSFVYFNDIVFTKVYDKRDDFDCEVVNFPFLESDIPRSTPYGVYISQFIQFARSSSHIADSNTTLVNVYVDLVVFTRIAGTS